MDKNHRLAKLFFNERGNRYRHDVGSCSARELSFPLSFIKIRRASEEFTKIRRASEEFTKIRRASEVILVNLVESTQPKNFFTLFPVWQEIELSFALLILVHRLDLRANLLVELVVLSTLPTPVHVLAGALADARLVRTAMDREDEYTVVFVSSSDEAGDTVRVRYNISGEQEDLFLPRFGPAPPAVASASPIGVPIISRSWSASALDELGGMDSDEERAAAASASPIGAPIISSADFAALDELGGMDSDEEDGADAGEDDGVDDDLPSLVRRLSSQPAPDGMGALPTTTATARRMSCVVGESFNIAAVTYIITACGGQPISVFDATGFDAGNVDHRRLGSKKGCARARAHPVVSALRDVLVLNLQSPVQGR
jgi:hypothetical protein